jgi:hypothetical protein
MATQEISGTAKITTPDMPEDSVLVGDDVTAALNMVHHHAIAATTQAGLRAQMAESNGDVREQLGRAKAREELLSEELDDVVADRDAEAARADDAELRLANEQRSNEGLQRIIGQQNARHDVNQAEIRTLRRTVFVMGAVILGLGIIIALLTGGWIETRTQARLNQQLTRVENQLALANSRLGIMNPAVQQLGHKLDRVDMLVEELMTNGVTVTADVSVTAELDDSFVDGLRRELQDIRNMVGSIKAGSRPWMGAKTTDTWPFDTQFSVYVDVDQQTIDDGNLDNAIEYYDYKAVFMMVAGEADPVDMSGNYYVRRFYINPSTNYIEAIEVTETKPDAVEVVVNR